MDELPIEKFARAFLRLMNRSLLYIKNLNFKNTILSSLFKGIQDFDSDQLASRSCKNLPYVTGGTIAKCGRKIRRAGFNEGTHAVANL